MNKTEATMEKNDIICLSSDDEFEPPKKTELPANKESDDDFIQAKEEKSSSENEEKETVTRKRKVICIDDSPRKQKDALPEKRRKLSPSEEHGDTIQSNSHEEDKNDNKKNCQINKEETNKITKPQLVVKERKSICQVDQDIFPMFIGLCLQKDRSNDMELIVGKLKRRYEQLDSEYVHSEAFTNLLNEKRDAIIEGNNKLYVHIMDVMNEMKSRIKREGSKTKTKTNVNPEVAIQESVLDKPTASTSVASISKPRSSIVQEAEVNNNAEIQVGKSLAVNKKVRKLEKAMAICEERIKRLEEAEVNFDDDDNSTYIQLEKYKERMVKLYNVYCNYTGEKCDAGRAYLRPKHISATGIVKVDQAITSFINSQIFKRNCMKSIGSNVEAVIFPDYMDILECITECNNTSNLGLEKTKREEIAKKAFIQLGEYLQRARRHDYWDTFSLFLEGKDVEDPALEDKELEQKLKKNQEIGETKLNQVFEEFVRKQEEKKEQQDDAEDATSTSNEDDETNYIEEITPKKARTSCTGTDDSDKSNTKVVTETKKSNEKSKETEIEVIAIDEEDEDKAEEATEEIERVEETIKVIKEVEKAEKNNVTSIKTVTPTKTVITMLKIDTDKTSVGKNSQVNKPIKSSGKKPEITKSITLNNKQVCKIASLMTATNDNGVMLVINSGDTNDENEKGKSQMETTVQDIDESKPQNDVTSHTDVTATIDKGTEDEVAEILPDDDNTRTDESKPLLRVRSFAKPPTTWKDEQQKAERSTKSSVTTSKGSSSIDLINLTNESPKKNDNSSKKVGKETLIKLSNNAKPVALTKCKTVTLPSGMAGIIRVKNVMNTYVNTTSSQVLSSDNRNVQPTVIGSSGHESTIIHVQHHPANAQSSSQQTTSVSKETIEMAKKHGGTVVQILPSGKAAIILRKGSVTTKSLCKTTNATGMLLAKQK